MACALNVRVAMIVLTIATSTSAHAQSIDACDALEPESERIRTLVQVEVTSFDETSLEGVQIELRECSNITATVRVLRDGVLLDARRVDLDDAAPSVRPRLIAYVVAEILLAANRPQIPSESAQTIPSTATPVVPTTEPAPPPGEVSPTTVRTPELRPWHVSIDAGVRWLAASRTHVGTYRLTTSIGRMLFEMRHSFGPLLGRRVESQAHDQTILFQSITVGVGFRYRRTFGDDAFFVDGVGAAGFVYLQRFDRIDGSAAGTRRFATAGLECRAGVEIGLGRVRGYLAAEFGYLRPRNGPKADFSPPPELQRSTGVFLGMTLGVGLETASGLRPMGPARRRLLVRSQAPSAIAASNH